jgi:hypothetical protein
MITDLIDHLMDAGYEPDEQYTPDGQPTGADVYDLIASGIGSVRLIAGDDYEIHAFDGFMVCNWTVKLSRSTPDPVIIATLEAAEWELAELRGGPVTPAQAATAR